MSSQLCMTVRSGTSSTVSGFWTVVQQLKRSPSSSAVFPWSTSFSCTFLVSNSCTAPQRNVLGSLLRTPRAIQWWFSRRRRNQCTRTTCFHFAVFTGTRNAILHLCLAQTKPHHGDLQAYSGQRWPIRKDDYYCQPFGTGRKLTDTMLQVNQAARL